MRVYGYVRVSSFFHCMITRLINKNFLLINGNIFLSIV